MDNLEFSRFRNQAEQVRDKLIELAELRFAESLSTAREGQPKSLSDFDSVVLSLPSDRVFTVYDVSFLLQKEMPKKRILEAIKRLLNLGLIDSVEHQIAMNREVYRTPNASTAGLSFDSKTEIEAASVLLNHFGPMDSISLAVEMNLRGIGKSGPVINYRDLLSSLRGCQDVFKMVHPYVWQVDDQGNE